MRPQRRIVCWVTRLTTWQTPRNPCRHWRRDGWRDKPWTENWSTTTTGNCKFWMLPSRLWREVALGDNDLWKPPKEDKTVLHYIPIMFHFFFKAFLGGFLNAQSTLTSLPNISTPFMSRKCIRRIAYSWLLLMPLWSLRTPRART